MTLSQKKLSPKDIEKKLKKLSEWTLNTKGTELSRIFTFPSYVTAFTFVARIVVHAEVMGHHPDIELSYGKVKVKLSTHDAKGLTNADFELAKKVNNL